MQALNPNMQPQQVGNAQTADNNPEFQAAVRLVMEALYKEGAAKDVAKGLRLAKDTVTGLYETAYEITSIADERTGGKVPDELIVLLGIKTLQEIADIADASGISFTPADIADAFKQMLLRFLGENGMDTTQLQAEMDKVDPAAFEAAAQSED